MASVAPEPISTTPHHGPHHQAAIPVLFGDDRRHGSATSPTSLAGAAPGALPGTPPLDDGDTSHRRPAERVEGTAPKASESESVDLDAGEALLNGIARDAGDHGGVGSGETLDEEPAAPTIEISRPVTGFGDDDGDSTRHPPVAPLPRLSHVTEESGSHAGSVSHASSVASHARISSLASSSANDTAGSPSSRRAAAATHMVMTPSGSSTLNAPRAPDLKLAADHQHHLPPHGTSGATSATSAFATTYTEGDEDPDTDSDVDGSGKQVLTHIDEVGKSTSYNRNLIKKFRSAGRMVGESHSLARRKTTAERVAGLFRRIRTGAVKRAVQRNARAFKMRVYRLVITGKAVDKTETWARRLILFAIYIAVIGAMFETIDLSGQAGRVQLAVALTSEIVATVVAIIEYVARLWACSISKDFPQGRPYYGRLMFALRWDSVCDIVFLLPVFVGNSVCGLDMYEPGEYLGFVSILRIVRSFRLIKFARYTPTVSTLLEVTRHKRDELTTAVLVCLSTVMLVSVCVYAVEQENPQFEDQFSALWWGLITLTTVGYGDITPLTPVGKLLGGFGAVVGIGLFTLPAGILASGFMDYEAKRHDHQREIVVRVGTIHREHALRMAFWHYRVQRRGMRRAERKKYGSPLFGAGSKRIRRLQSDDGIHSGTPPWPAGLATVPQSPGPTTATSAAAASLDFSGYESSPTATRGARGGGLDPSSSPVPHAARPSGGGQSTFSSRVDYSSAHGRTIIAAATALLRSAGGDARLAVDAVFEAEASVDGTNSDVTDTKTTVLTGHIVKHGSAGAMPSSLQKRASGKGTGAGAGSAAALHKSVSENG